MSSVHAYKCYNFLFSLRGRIFSQKRVCILCSAASGTYTFKHICTCTIFGTASQCPKIIFHALCVTKLSSVQVKSFKWLLDIFIFGHSLTWKLTWISKSLEWPHSAQNLFSTHSTSQSSVQSRYGLLKWLPNYSSSGTFFLILGLKPYGNHKNSNMYHSTLS